MPAAPGTSAGTRRVPWRRAAFPMTTRHHKPAPGCRGSGGCHGKRRNRPPDRKVPEIRIQNGESVAYEGGVVPVAPGAGRQHERRRSRFPPRVIRDRPQRNRPRHNQRRAADTRPRVLHRARPMPCGCRPARPAQSSRPAARRSGRERARRCARVVAWRPSVRRASFVSCGLACRRPPRLREASDSDYRLVAAGRMKWLNLFGGGVAGMLGDRVGIAQRSRSASRG